MTTLKRKALLGVAALAGAVALAGCGDDSGSEGSNGAQEITIWDMEQSAKDIPAGYQSVVKQFEKDHSGVTVKVETFPFEQYRDKMLVAMKGGTGPDVMTLDQVWTPEFAAAGVIQPLDDFIAESDVVKEEDFFEGAWLSNQYEDKAWGVPLNFDVWEQLYYNADMFRDAGLDPDSPPTTWEEWLEVASKLNSPPDRFGIGLIGCKEETSSVLTDSFIFSNGGNILDDSGQVAFNSPENVAAYEQYQALLEFAPNGTANACEQEVVNPFTAGKVAMMLGGSWQQDTLETAANFDWRIALPPAPAGKEFVGALGGWNLAVNAKSENPDLAFELIELLSQPENQMAVNSLTPALKTAGEQFVNENRKQPEVILEALAGGLPRPASPVYPQLSEVQQGALQEIIGGAEVQPTLDDAADEMQQIIDANS